MRLFSNLRWRYEVWKNRRRHPDLIERERDGEDPIYVAQQMLVRDRIEMRKKGIHPPNPLYPDLWDYHFPPSLRRRGIWWSRFKRALSAYTKFPVNKKGDF